MWRSSTGGQEKEETCGKKASLKKSLTAAQTVQKHEDYSGRAPVQTLYYRALSTGGKP